MKMEIKTGVIHSQAKKYLEPPEDEKSKAVFSSRDSRESAVLLAFLDFGLLAFRTVKV